MKRSPKAAERRERTPEPESALCIEFDAEVLRRVRQHARSSMSAEICGVLIGNLSGRTTIVEASIPGEAARQGGSHVTFTQETWTHIYQVKDAQYPDQRIVGWYHSHPGFGVFLSEHDTFIHRNFFSNPNQVAWVFDPHSDEEGCFAWQGGEIVRVTELAVHDRPNPAGTEKKEAEPDHPVLHPAEAGEPSPQPKDSGRSRAARWIGLVMSHLLVLGVGFVIGYLMAPPVLLVPDHGERRPEIAAPAPQGDQKK
ncbi:MAG TPA: Mov34/MPN/PAD-1 family protein [Bryobacteraceae bacterium]|nr:Mov34/MPN/PAD-1 family protein [Bryobacteraceae bacterium]